MSRSRIRYDSNRTKKLILKWAKKHGRLPNRRSNGVMERRHALRMENFLSKKSKSFDPYFRATIYSKYPRKVNQKREHDKELRIKEVLDFIKEHKRIPSATIESEKLLRVTLQNYSSAPGNGNRGSQAFDKAVKNIDKCYRTMIPAKFRSCINLALKNKDLEEEF